MNSRYLTPSKPRTTKLSKINEDGQMILSKLPKWFEPGLAKFHSLLGLSSDSDPASSAFRPPIYIALPSTRQKVDVPFTTSILDLLDVSSVSPANIITTHTFTGSRLTPKSNTDTSQENKKDILVTATEFSLPQLVPEKRNIIFVTIHPNYRIVDSLTRSLGLRATIGETLDIETLSEGMIIKCGSRPVLKCLYCPEEAETEDLLRGMLLLAVASIETKDFDEEKIAWVDCLRAIGMAEPGEKEKQTTEVKKRPESRI